MEGLDQFFTRVEDADKFINITKKLFKFEQFDNIIEPSAGSGAFLQGLPATTIALDLEPLADNIKKQDFFDFVFPGGKTLVIGNPPYGRRGALAAEFFNKSAKYADVIAFILPRSFVKNSMKNKLDKAFHLVAEKRLDTFVLPNGTTHKVRSVFQVWEKRDTLRKKIVEATEHPDFELTHRHLAWTDKKELADTAAKFPICIGQNSMQVKKSVEVSKGSIWFIKPKTDAIRKKFFDIDFKVNIEDTTGAPSLSKGDIIRIYSEA